MKKKSDVYCLLLLLVTISSMFYFPGLLENIPLVEPDVNTEDGNQSYGLDPIQQEEPLFGTEATEILTAGEYRLKGFFTQDNFVELDENGYVFELEEYDDLSSSTDDYTYARFYCGNQTSNPDIFWHPMDTYAQLRTTNLINGEYLNSTMFTPEFDADTYIQGRAHFVVSGDVWPSAYNEWQIKIILEVFNPATNGTTYINETSGYFNDGQYQYYIDIPSTTYIQAGYRLRITYEAMLPSEGYTEEAPNEVELRTGYVDEGGDWIINDANNTYDKTYSFASRFETFGMQLYMRKDYKPRINVFDVLNNTVYYESQNATLVPENTNVSQYRWNSDQYTSFNTTTIIQLPETTEWHTLDLWANDSYNNIFQTTYLLGFDANPVGVILHNVANNSLISDNMLLNFTVLDPVGNQFYEWDDSGTQILFNAPYDIYPNNGFTGTHKLAIETTDIFGSSTTTFYFEFDNSAPAISLDNVVNGSTLPTQKNIDLEITDRCNDLNVTYKWDNNTYSTLPQLSGDIYRTLLPSSEGWHNLTVIAVDDFGLEATKLYTFNASTFVLLVELTNMLNNSYFYGGNDVEVTIVNYNGTCKYFWDSNPWSNGTVIDDVLTLSGTEGLSETPGVYTLTVIVGDIQNIQQEYVFTFTVDRTKPTISQVLTDPDYNHSRFHTSASLTFTFDDDLTPGGISVLLSLDMGLNQTLDAPYTFYLTGLSDGTHELYLYATDVAGNTESYYITFIIDTTRPGRTVSVSGQVRASDYQYYIDINTLVTCTLSDADPGARIFYQWNNSVYIEFTSTLSFTLPDIEGKAILRILANDTVGNYRTWYRWYTIDGTAPTITLNSLNNNSKISLETILEFEVNDLYDNTLDYTKYKWEIDLDYSTREDPTEFSTILNPIYFIDSYTEAFLLVETRDIVGNLKNNTYRFILDFEEPTFELLGGVQDGDFLQGGAILEVGITCDDLQSFAYSWDGGVFELLSEPYNIVVPELDGIHNLTIVLEDDAGGGSYPNVAEASFSFTVDDLFITFLDPENFTENFYETIEYNSNFTFSLDVRDRFNDSAINGLTYDIIYQNPEYALTLTPTQLNETSYQFSIDATNVTNGLFTTIEVQFWQFENHKQSVNLHLKILRKEGTFNILSIDDNIIYSENISFTFQLKDDSDVSPQSITFLSINDNHIDVSYQLVDVPNLIFEGTFNSADFLSEKGEAFFEFYVESNYFFGVKNDTTTISVTILPYPITLSVAVSNQIITVGNDLTVSASLIRQDSQPVVLATIKFCFYIFYSEVEIADGVPANITGFDENINQTTETNANGNATTFLEVTEEMKYIIVVAEYNGDLIYDAQSTVLGDWVSIVPAPGLPIRIIIIIIVSSIIFSIIMAFVVYRLVRAKPFDTLMERVSEEDIAMNTELLSPGVVLSIFDQSKGPIPLITDDSFEVDRYKKRMRIGSENFLLKICDQAYSSLGFEEHDESRRTGSIKLPNEKMVGFIHGIQLENKTVRGGFENLSLIVLADSEVSKYLLSHQEYMFEEIDELIVALKLKRPLAEIRALLALIRRRSIIIMLAAKKADKNADKKDK